MLITLTKFISLWITKPPNLILTTRSLTSRTNTCRSNRIYTINCSSNKLNTVLVNWTSNNHFSPRTILKQNLQKWIWNRLTQQRSNPILTWRARILLGYMWEEEITREARLFHLKKIFTKKHKVYFTTNTLSITREPILAWSRATHKLRICTKTIILYLRWILSTRPSKRLSMTLSNRWTVWILQIVVKLSITKMQTIQVGVKYTEKGITQI